MTSGRINQLSLRSGGARAALVWEVWKSAPLKEITPTLPSFPDLHIGGEETTFSAEKRRKMSDRWL
jgi:hypothetical protein